MTVYQRNRKRYGAPRIHRTLQKQGVLCGRHRVARRMKAIGIYALAKRPYKVTTNSEHQQPVFDNVLNRNFTTTSINQKWVGDITYIPTLEGWLYLAVIIDLHSRAVIGWAMSQRMKTSLVCDALLMALEKRHFPEGVVVHSDRGSQYCSHRYRRILEINKLQGSMSRRGDCWDNAVAESFFHTLKTELVNQTKYQTRSTARQDIFTYIEGYYNNKRMHSAIDYQVSNEFELAA